MKQQGDKRNQNLENLPIFRDSMHLADQLMTVVPDFPKTFRYNIGQRLINGSLDLLELVDRVNNSYNKGPLLQQLLDKQRMMLMLLRLCDRHKLISRQKHTMLSGLLNSVGRQGGGMLKHFAVPPSPTPVSSPSS